MARQISKILVLSMIPLCLALPASSYGQNQVDQTVGLSLDSGTPLEAGEYETNIKLPNGRHVSGRINVKQAEITKPASAAKEPSPSKQEAPSPIPAATTQTAQEQAPVIATQSSSLPIIAMIVGIVGVLAAIGVIYYVRIIVPRQRIEPYNQAMEMIRAKEYERALPILTKIEGKLPDDLRTGCRFFIAFARYQTGDLDRAAIDLENLKQEEPNNIPIAYFLAYIYVEKNDLKKADPLLEQLEKKGSLNYQQCQRLLGILKFRRAYMELKEGHVDAAEDLFEKVKALGDFKDQIPGDLRDRNLVLGTKALFDADTTEARVLFNRLASEAGNDSGNAFLLASAKTGLALADWIDERPAEEVERQLTEAVRLINPKDTLRQPWKNIIDTAPDDSITRLEKLETAEEGTTLKASQDPNVRILRDIHFLRAMNVLRGWNQMEGEPAYKKLPETYQEVLEILTRSQAFDQRFSDIYLAAGLLMYYLHKPGQEERSTAIDLLQKAQRLGMREPSALEIINAREKAREANKGPIDTYLQVLDKYINDATVRQEVRMRLITQRRRFQRTARDAKQTSYKNISSAAPTLDEMQKRTAVLLERISQIVQEQPRAETDEISKLCGEIQRGTEMLKAQAQTVESSEAALLEKTGNQLFRD
jgi:tetratricopeptide (TPR) repeat protein